MDVLSDLPAAEERPRPFGIGVVAVGARMDETVRVEEQLAVALAAKTGLA